MYNNLKNNIQTGNDRINRLKSRILSYEYNNKYKVNKIKNSDDSGVCNEFHKLPYIQNNSDKLLISRGFFDCSRNNTFDKQVLNSHNNYYSLKTSNNYLIYNSGTDENNNTDLSFNTMTHTDIKDKDIFVANTYFQKTRKKQLNELNNFSDKYDDKCGNKVYKQSSVKIYNLIKNGRNINAQDGNTNRNCEFLDPTIT